MERPLEMVPRGSGETYVHVLMYSKCISEYMVCIRVGTWNLASHLASDQRNQVLRHGSTLEPVPSFCKEDLCPENYIHKP